MKFTIIKSSIFNYIALFEIDSHCILTGSFFDEGSLIHNNKKFCEFLNDDEISQILNKCQIIIISNIKEILSLPYLFKKFNITNKIIITTEPIKQISKYYLLEFYSCLNKIIIETTENEVETKGKLLNIKQNQETYITEIDINLFIDSIHCLNYIECYEIETYLKLYLTSSNFNLGSSNFYFEYFNKKIGVLNKSSNLTYRYPKHFQHENLENCDVLITLPEIINYNCINENEDNFGLNISSLTSEIYKIVNTRNYHQSEGYPSIFLPTEPFFLLDFVDVFLYKVPKDIKIIYISKSIKSIFEYSNVSHGFINQNIHNKIYEFKLPFNYDELIKNSK